MPIFAGLVGIAPQHSCAPDGIKLEHSTPSPVITGPAGVILRNHGGLTRPYLTLPLTQPTWTWWKRPYTESTHLLGTSTHRCHRSATPTIPTIPFTSHSSLSSQRKMVLLKTLPTMLCLAPPSRSVWMLRILLKNRQTSTSLKALGAAWWDLPQASASLMILVRLSLCLPS